MRPTYIEVNLGQLKRNLQAIREYVAPAKVLVVVKANAYGHGVDGVAPCIAPYADYLGVALAEEGIHLRELGIDRPILVMGGTFVDQLPDFFKYNLTLTASSSELLAAADRLSLGLGRPLTVHLKIDTGMERVGVRDAEAEPFLEQSIRCTHLNVEGIYTHLANSELSDHSHSDLQIERFTQVLSFYERRNLPPPPIRHICNSGGILQLPHAHLDMVRPGIMIYGVYPGDDVPHTVQIHPALTWRSRVVYSKITPPGRPVGYGSLWEPASPTRIVTIPCGYADGYFRRMTNKARVLIRGKLYPQVGRICMDQFMVNVGEDDIPIGEPVTLLGEGISSDDMGEWAGTNNYEPLTNISVRVPRVYVDD